ncbi:Pentatricopeptide repeat-containing protein [Camellia lanceoleosa]|uniref:Pentatricopeptide repeat-containing protein n=1 Tax=Camellia lanceoleosa TaxID=1840588 RepID=A0ACC0IR90_9ERIC|nr:Pentatricopeptide repeat-containing protein [Camellia lanceoleosa]
MSPTSIIHRYQKLGATKGFPPDLVTYNVIVDGLCKVGNLEEAYELLQEMVRDGLLPAHIGVHVPPSQMLIEIWANDFVIGISSFASELGIGVCDSRGGLEMGARAIAAEDVFDEGDETNFVIVMGSSIVAMFLLQNLASNIMLYMYCKALHGELAGGN